MNDDGLDLFGVDLMSLFTGGGGGGGGGGLFSSGQSQSQPSATAVIEKQLAEEKARNHSLKVVAVGASCAAAVFGGLLGWAFGGR